MTSDKEDQLFSVPLLEKDELLMECVNEKVDTTKEKSDTSSVVSTETRTKEEDVMEIVEIE